MRAHRQLGSRSRRITEHHAEGRYQIWKKKVAINNHMQQFFSFFTYPPWHLEVLLPQKMHQQHVTLCKHCFSPKHPFLLLTLITIQWSSVAVLHLVANHSHLICLSFFLCIPPRRQITLLRIYVPGGPKEKSRYSFSGIYTCTEKKKALIYWSVSCSQITKGDWIWET